MPATEPIARKRVIRALGVTPPVPSPAAGCGGVSTGAFFGAGALFVAIEVKNAHVS